MYYSKEYHIERSATDMKKCRDCIYWQKKGDGIQLEGICRNLASPIDPSTDCLSYPSGKPIECNLKLTDPEDDACPEFKESKQKIKKRRKKKMGSELDN